METAMHRACSYCRSQKVRCLPDENNPSACQRCTKQGRVCMPTLLQKRKQRKRTDTRVAELEREMSSMRALLANKQAGHEPADLPSTSGPQAMRGQRQDSASSINVNAPESSTDARPLSLTDRIHQGRGPQLWPINFADKPTDVESDVIDRGILSMSTARQLFDIYKTDLFPHYPMIPIADSMSADDMRRSRPTLFLAVIAAAAGKQDSELSATLDHEILKVYAAKSLVQSQKSLELCQALLCSAVWYHPPSKFGQLKYYEYIHMAAAMALDLGIGSRPTQSRGRFGPSAASRQASGKPHIHPAEDPSDPDLSMAPRTRDTSTDTANIESRRTFLACFIVCSGVSLGLRRPNMLRTSSYIRDCVDYLEHASDALPTDSVLVAWAKLLMLADQISVSLEYDDPGQIASISQLRTQLMIKDFAERLTAWRTAHQSCMNGSLVIMYYTVRLYIFEVALHLEHSPDDFRAPYQMGVLDISPDAATVPTHVLADAISECIASSHSLLESFLSLKAANVGGLPVFSYVRVCFASFILAKLCLSASHPESRIGRVLDRRSLKVESYLERTILHVRNCVGPNQARVPAIFLALLFKLRQWCLSPEMIERTEEEQSVAEDSSSADFALNSAVGNGKSTKASRISGPSNSSNDTSPRTLAGGQQIGYSGTGSAAMHALRSASASLTPDSCPIIDRGSGSVGIYAGTGIEQVTGNIDFAAHLNHAGSMELEDDFMKYLEGSISGLPEGGLTGLNDWMSADFTGFGLIPDTLNWQSA